MNRAFSEMVHCLDTPGNIGLVKGMEMSVLERQRTEPPQLQEELSCFNDISMLSFLPAEAQDFQGPNMNYGPSPVTPGPTLNEILNRPIKADPDTESRWVDFGMPKCGVTAESSGRESFKKRKAGKNLGTPKAVDAEEDGGSKKVKVQAEEVESKITEQISNRNNTSSQSNQKASNGNKNDKKNSKTSRSPKDNSKASEAEKLDYIHVRARRGQATDSHSLAERVRREKINGRMKYLRDLVPGCNKITGKAGMLDEIINYVQSLQQQIEFLSRKLAAVNPRLNFSIDDVIVNEVFAACSTSPPTIGVSPDLTNPSYLHYNPSQQMNPVCGYEVAVEPTDMGRQRSISAPVSKPDTFFTSYFNAPLKPAI